jgi:hypothetical protein
MGYQHTLAFAGKECELLIYAAYHSAVNVAPHTTQRLEGCNLVGKLQRPEVTSVPYLIHIFEELTQRLVKAAVSVRYYSYASH